VITQQRLDAVKVRGEIGMKSGILLGLVSAQTPDDPAKIQKIRTVASEILKTPL
jgi:hypothetical protein